MHKRWGWMLTLFRGSYFKIKILYFNTHGQISLQRHKHRSELWLFIFGSGKFYNDNAIENVKSGHYKNVLPLMWHRFTAFESTLVLEIQYGDKCSERDIERA